MTSTSSTIPKNIECIVYFFDYVVVNGVPKKTYVLHFIRRFVFNECSCRLPAAL